ncbi:MAG TPA: putative peptidoglycan glycosyltransferase FtsW [Rhodothermales bacterium]|nr:putative peptidoglycan glycosyltransferase FtsW [Rhodothermales bacterium]
MSSVRTRTFPLPPVDKAVVATVLLLSSAGVLAVYSAVAFLAETKAAGDTERFLLKHVLRLVLSLGAAGVVSLIDYRRIARASKWVLVGALGLLAAVQVVGTISGGAQRWLELGPVTFQPSDIACVALVLHVAVLLARKQPYVRDFGRAFVPMAAWIGATVVLIGVDNLSMASLLLVTVSVMLFVGRVPMPQLLAAAGIGAVLATGLLLSSPQRAARVESFVGVSVFGNTDSTAVFSTSAEGYQAEQARIAFAMGGITGVGPGHSTQRDFLPAPYNDFIYAIVGEEYGFVGAVALLMLFVSLLLRGFLRIARGAPDPLGLFLAVGLTTSIVLDGFVNAAVATGLFPVTGLPMPFVSYGGTSMLMTGVMVGILLNVSRHSAQPDEEAAA